MIKDNLLNDSFLSTIDRLNQRSIDRCGEEYFTKVEILDDDTVRLTGSDAFLVMGSDKGHQIVLNTVYVIWQGINGFSRGAKADDYDKLDVSVQIINNNGDLVMEQNRSIDLRKEIF